MYANLLRNFTAGTSSITKQAFLNTLLQLGEFDKHKCLHKLTFTTGATKRTQDNFVYDRNFKVYQVIGQEQDDIITVEPLPENTRQYYLEDGTEIPFREIGVHLLAGNVTATQGGSLAQLQMSEVEGKCVVSGKYIICIPTNALYESSF